MQAIRTYITMQEHGVQQSLCSQGPLDIRTCCLQSYVVASPICSHVIHMSGYRSTACIIRFVHVHNIVHVHYILISLSTSKLSLLSLSVYIQCVCLHDMLIIMPSSLMS